ncbi:hypothetical protein TEA_021162 [Camellia sinensis var. sinensis]|uniref:UBA domain-containing protein n=1 Tax=Camellia sinensis var. sinensis TaxID=542762 RepID=A0A4S4DHP0_CAMSN|nr:hypothetical protein TEA_021162 [Camellia sinensis var. sinensis]
MAKLKIAGAWSGVLEVELEEWTVPMLREEVAKRSNCGSESINLICAGKVLKDGDGTQKLAQLGFKNNSKVLASRVSADQGKALKDELMAEEERSTRLSRLKAAVNSLAKRHADGSLPIEDYNIELENQSGETVQLGSETDQRAVMMGLMLHANAKQLIRTERYKDALEVLAMGEIWCGATSCSETSVGSQWQGMRLSKAKEGIERAHGKESSRLRLLQGARHPEIALHLRMELLEGVVAYHSGQFEKSRQALTSAQTKYFQLQVPDEALSLLMSMGYKEHHAKRALRMSNQDVQSAVDFLVEEKAKKAQKQEEDIRRRNDIMEQKCYGMTPLKKPVDLQRLNELVSIGFAKDLAAEALRRNENDTQKALDDLTNPESNSAIQLDIESKKRKRLRRAADAAIEELISMGFPRATVVEAVRAFGTKDRALSHLLGQSDSNPAIAVDGDANSSASTLGADILSTEGGVEGSSSVNGDIEGPSHKIDDRDVEMEVELTEDLHNADAFSDYDIEVAKEGEAISEYLALLASSENGEKVSSSSH